MLGQPAAVLMYHRICEESPATAPYFERGTAVTPLAFAEQMAWLKDHATVVPLSQIQCSNRQPGFRVAVTLDDGYADVVDHALPVLHELGITATVFVVQRQGRQDLWFDRWYAQWQCAKQRPVLKHLCAAASSSLPADPDLAWWVNGPVKRWLASLAAHERDPWLAILEQSEIPSTAPGYLTDQNCRTLVAAGWALGGHGTTHSLLTSLSDSDLVTELAASYQFIQQFCTPAHCAFAYPDGAWDARVAAAVARSGFHLACTVESGVVTAETPFLRIPRLFCRGSQRLPHPALAEFAHLGRLAVAGT